MKTLFKTFVAILLISTSFTTAHADGFPKGKRFTGFPEGLWGVGLALGEPSGLQAHYFTGWKQAWSFTAGYSFSKAAVVGVDYLFYGYNAKDKIVDKNFWNSLIFYAGPGAKLGFGIESDPNDSLQVAVRALGGAEYIFTDSSWSVRLEAAPELYFKGRNGFGIGFIIGATYYFFDKVPERKKYFRPGSKNSKPTYDESEF